MTSRRLLVGFGRRGVGADFQIAIGGAQVGPIDIGAKVFAADGASGHALDGNAAVKRNAAINPLTDGARRHAERFRQRDLASNYFCGAFNGVHNPQYIRAKSACQ